MQLNELIILLNKKHTGKISKENFDNLTHLLYFLEELNFNTKIFLESIDNDLSNTGLESKILSDLNWFDPDKNIPLSHLLNSFLKIQTTIEKLKEHAENEIK